MRYYSLILTLLLAACTLLSCGSKESDREAAEAGATDTVPTLVMQIQKCSRLYTTEYKIHKIVTHDDVLRLKGNVLRKEFDIPLPLGERKIAIPMDATLKAYIDFADFSERNIERNGQKIVVLLPDPQVVMTSSKIRQEDIKEYVGLARSHFSDQELTHYEQQGRQAILQSVPTLGITEQARENAARVLVPLLVEMGWREEDVTIAFRKDLDIMKLINTNLEKK